MAPDSRLPDPEPDAVRIAIVRTQRGTLALCVTEFRESGPVASVFRVPLSGAERESLVIP